MNKSILAVDWLPDETLITMSLDGELCIWAAVAAETGSLEFVQRQVKGKNKSKSAPMTVMKVCEPNVLITGDQNGILKSYYVNEDDFRLVKTYDVGIHN